MKKILLFSILSSSLFSCDFFYKKNKTGNDDDKTKMMNADRAFSRLSEEKGMKKAFLDYIDSNGVLLRSNHLPLLGADAIDFLIQQNDSAYTLKWEPKNGTVAASGELGYTYGIYVLKPATKDTLIYGNYVSIWKKQSDGNWKFVLDSGNEGIGDEQ
jgi:ketosteroid isomerase-like protein